MILKLVILYHLEDIREYKIKSKKQDKDVRKALRQKGRQIHDLGKQGHETRAHEEAGRREADRLLEVRNERGRNNPHRIEQREDLQLQELKDRAAEEEAQQLDDLQARLGLPDFYGSGFAASLNLAANLASKGAEADLRRQAYENLAAKRGRYL